MSALRNAGDTRDCQLEQNEFRLTFSNEGQHHGTLNLTNLYAEFCSVDKAKRKQCMSEMVRAALSHLKEMPTDFVDASHDIRPRVWTRITYEQLRLKKWAEGGGEVDWPMEPIGEHLVMSLVYDLPESVRSISNRDLEEWGVSYWQAREVAVRNLEDTKLVYASLGNELYASNTGDSYDATRMILTDLFQGLDIKGQPVAMVPNRDTLLVSGTETDVGQKMMIELAAQQLSEQPRPMIATPLIFTPDGQWEDWMPDPDNSLYADYQKLKIKFLQQEYADQKSMLDEINQHKMIDEFIAAYTVATKDEQFHSYCVWSQGVLSLLPETDVIALFLPETEQSVVCPWGEVYERSAHLFEETEFYPKRFRVSGFPDQKTIGELQELQILED